MAFPARRAKWIDQISSSHKSPLAAKIITPAESTPVVIIEPHIQGGLRGGGEIRPVPAGGLYFPEKFSLFKVLLPSGEWVCQASVNDKLNFADDSLKQNLKTLSRHPQRRILSASALG